MPVVKDTTSPYGDSERNAKIDNTKKKLDFSGISSSDVTSKVDKANQ